MNTVKRWLAGFLSFAMIFTSAAFGNVGTVFAAQVPENDSNAVAKLTIDGDITYWTSVAEAIGAANLEAENQNGILAGNQKVITIDLLHDAAVNWDESKVRVPLTINPNEFAFNASDLSTYRWSGYGDKKVCPSIIYSGGKLQQVIFATHNPNYEFNWKLNSVTKNWYVDSYKEVCPNCGESDQGVFTGNANDANTYFQWNPAEQGNYARISNNYFTSEFDETKNVWNLNEYTRSGWGWNFNYTYVKTWSSFDATKGYVLDQNSPYFDKNGNMIKHNADGTPVIRAKIYRVSNGETISDSEIASKKLITVTKATTKELETINANLSSMDQASKEYYTTVLGNRTKLENIEPTCNSFGETWYHVIVTDPDGETMFDRYMLDYQGEKIQEHKAGRIEGIQLLKRGTYYSNGQNYGWETASAAMAAAEGRSPVREVVKVTKDFIDWAGDGYGHTNDEFCDFDGYYYWYWETIPADVELGELKRRVHFALDETGSFTYRTIHSCYYNEGSFDSREVVYGDPVKVNPLADVTGSAEDITKALAASTATTANELDRFPNSAFSTCTHWNYAKVSIQEEYIDESGKKVKPESKYNYIFPTLTKNVDLFSHVPTTDASGHNNVVHVDPTCCRPGSDTFTCLICGNPEAQTIIPATNKDHKFIAYPEKLRTGAAPFFNIEDVDRNLTARKADGSFGHVWAWSDDYETITIEPTCVEDGGVYKFCVDKETVPATSPDYGKNGTWVLTEVKKAAGHKLSMVAPTEAWNDQSDNSAIAAHFVGGLVSYNSYNPKTDYQFFTTMTCSDCKESIDVRFHSVEGEDTVTPTTNGVSYSGAGIAEIYKGEGKGISVEVQDKGPDCMTKGQIIWTVNGITGKDGKSAVVKKVDNTKGKFGDHDLDNIKWTWAEGYETATATGTCKKCKTSQTATVEAKKETAADGITTFTATYGSSTDTKKAYTLVGATVTYDTSLLTDGNLVEGIEGAAPQVPDVTVTLNGTVIDSDLYEATWTYNRTTKAVDVSVDWTKDVKDSTAADHVDATASAETFYLAAKKQIQDVDFDLYANDELTYEWVNEYDPAVTYTLKTTSTPSNVAVKYAILDKKVTADAKDPDALQKKIEGLTFDKDKVELKEVGKYFVYAQLTKDGYTTYTTYVGEIEITEKKISVYVNNLEMTVGETPELEKAAYDAKGRKIDVDWEAENFKFTAAGGKEFKDLSAGTYLIWVEAPNYIVTNSGASGENRVGTITVKAKTDDQKAAEEVITALKAAGDDAAKLAAAYEKFNALTDAQKQIVKADNEANAKLAAAEKAYNDKQAADKAAKELADAKTAANSAIAAANAYASDANIKALIDALNAAIAKGDAAAIKNATAALNSAVDAKKKAEPQPASVKLSKTKYTIKRGKSAKIKYSKTTDSSVTFKKKSGKSFITVSKGKIKVKNNKAAKKGKGKTYKVKITVSTKATAKYKAFKKTMTVKVKVK